MTKIVTGGSVALVAVLAFVFGQNITSNQVDISAATSQAQILQNAKLQKEGAITKQGFPLPGEENTGLSGCMEPLACNYDEKATVKGSCIFAQFVKIEGNGKFTPADSNLRTDPSLASYPAPTPKPNNTCAANDKNCIVHIGIKITQTDGNLGKMPKVGVGKEWKDNPYVIAFGYFTADKAKNIVGKNACLTDMAKAEVDKIDYVDFVPEKGNEIKKF